MLAVIFWRIASRTSSTVLQHTDRIIEEVGLLPYDASKSFDSTEADSCKLEQCPFPYGPTVDDEGHVVMSVTGPLLKAKSYVLTFEHTTVITSSGLVDH